MTNRNVPMAIAYAAREAFTCMLQVYETSSQRDAVLALLNRCTQSEGLSVGVNIVRSYLGISLEPTNPAGYHNFYASGTSFQEAIQAVFDIPPKSVVAKENPEDEFTIVVTRSPHILAPDDGLRACLETWISRWDSFSQLWLAWSRNPQVAQATAQKDPPTSAGDTLANPVSIRILSDDEDAACERLLALVRVRAETTESVLPTSVLSRWSVPFLVGPAASGKAFACEEVARRWGNKVYRRWDIGSWIITANRSSYTTLEQMQAFIENNPQGCVIYLAGVDALAANVGHNIGYYLAIASEVEQVLEWTSARPMRVPRRDGRTFEAKVLVVAGGRFAPLWGDSEVGGPTGSDLWRLADSESLADARSVASWLADNSGVPVGILRRLATEPLLLRRMRSEEAERLAARLHDNLPRSLDGISAEELATALLSPHGWRAVDEIIQHALIVGYEHLPLSDENTGTQASEIHKPSEVKAAKAPRPARLGEKLGLPASHSRLLGKARRLGLRTASDLESLAIARDYFLPGECEFWFAPEKVRPAEFSNLELAMALLSPCLEFCQGTIDRGVLVLRAEVMVSEPIKIVMESQRARADLVIRHIALIGRELAAQHEHWRKILGLLPRVSPENPVLKAGVMRDESIRRILAASVF